MKSLVIVFSAMLWLTACGMEATETDYTFSNEGELCVHAAEPVDLWNTNVEQSYMADQPLTFTVRFVTCLSSSCSDNYVTECSASVEGNTVTITSNGGYTDLGHDTCTTDCRQLAATCNLDSGLPEGEYTVVHGEDSMSLTIASTVTTPCVGGTP